ncbi:hypothetical protein SAMN00777080_3693 [Aquiflexum balticum DSM 16537]|uniref:Uncharacterized protein n=1 Tax=Aquiflexum balticum DSM 16537 TaxID=758820 RepID=A0A1W2H8M1_9BACT|nr:hypothetical protein [Aquiflexum balticum]SMD45052.1 hypothetical protein SAMN00777080_3693 [Aquiflexum balticum DSM 16537]
MKIASLAEIKKELSHLSEIELKNLIIDLSKFSTDNKSYLFFKLYERDNPRLYVEMVQEELEMEFVKANTRHYHFAKKSIQAIRRKLNKYLKLSKDKTAQIELILYFCEKMRLYGFMEFNHPVINNLYTLQISKVEKLISGLHEDLQYDYEFQINELKKVLR